MNTESCVSEKMLAWILLLFLTSGNGQRYTPEYTQESTESTPRLPWNRYEEREWERDQNVGFGFRNPLGQNENVIIRES